MRSFTAAIIAAVFFLIATGVAAWAAPDAWTGSILTDGASVYNAPGGTRLGTLAAGTPVTVEDWQYGPQLTSDNFTWADIGDGRFVHSSVLRHAPLADSPPIAPQIVSSGHWADANLTLETLTLYDGSQPV